MAKAPFSDYLQEISLQREAWQRKAVLRELYQHWYAQLVAVLAPLKPVIEVGSGCGNFKAYYPECIATDVFKSGPWIDRVVDAQDLPFAEKEAGNIVAFDVLHHLQRPLHFLRQAATALQPGGRLVLCEPAVTPWARLIYSLHHERLDTRWDLFGLDGTPPEPDPGHTFANMAIPEVLFWKERARTLAAVPQLRLLSAHKFGFLLYPLTGGFNYRSVIPHFGFKTCLRLENALLRPLADWLTGLRMLVVLEKV
ncbi:MAG: methyltransferase domain-containing protein [Planctomycetota bacterium]